MKTYKITLEGGTMDERLRDRFKEYLEADSQTLSSVSRSIGISVSSLSQWLSGTYPGNNAKIDEMIEGFLRRQAERKKSPQKKLPFVKTQSAMKGLAAAAICHTESELGALTGNSGDGKTVVVKKYVEDNSDCILLEIDPGCTPWALLSDISKRLGLDGRGTIHAMMEEIISKLRGSGRLLIVDEAESLSTRSLELLRRIHDKAEVGVLLVGMPRLLANLRGKKGELLQLYSRVGVSAKLEALTEHDTEQLVATMFPGINGLSKTFHAESRANARTLVKLMFRANKLSELNDRPIDSEMIRAAAETLIIG